MTAKSSNPTVATPQQSGFPGGRRASQDSRRAALRAVLAAGATASPLWALLTGCASGGAKPPVADAPDFDAWAEALAAERVRLSPHLATFWQYFSGAEQQAMDRQLRTERVGFSGMRVPLATTGLAQLERFDTAKLTSKQRLEAATLRWVMQSDLSTAPFEDHTFSFNQFRGTHLLVVNLLTSWHPMRRSSDVDNWLARLELAGGRIDEGRARAQTALDRGLLPPRFIVERSRAQVGAFLAPAAAQNVLVENLERRSAAIPDLGADQREAAIKRATLLVETQVRPAYQRLGQWMDELLPQCGDDAGLWRLPGGEDAYAAALADNTTTTMSAREIHDMGLREVARIEAEMDQVLRGLGRTQGSVNERFAALEKELQPLPGADPRPALLARYEAYVREAQERARPLFNLKPRAAVIVEREPALTEATAAASYNAPAPDGSRPGVFRRPLPGPLFETMRMKSLTVHETVPGHHFQIALQQEQAALPRWRQRGVFSGGPAYVEGWALYAEALAIEQGWYEGDPHSLLGALESQLFRARRLVVDTGLHAFRWTRQQAIDYGMSAQEVERYVVMPGQACAYMVGMLRILEMREQAQRRLGTRFTLPAFHDVVLKTGSVPLDVLANVVEEWAQTT